MSDGMLRQWFRWVSSHKLMIMWPLGVFLIAFVMIAWLVTRSPAAPFIYTR